MQIKQISYEQYKGKVYNFHCSPDENYFANNVLVHNCYKSNTPVGKNMSLDTFRKVIDKMPITLTQIAIGADAHLDQNPDLWDMMDYANSKGIAVNITCANIDDETARLLSQKCKAVAVSRYQNKDWCYDSIKRLTDSNLNKIIYVNDGSD